MAAAMLLIAALAVTGVVGAILLDRQQNPFRRGTSRPRRSGRSSSRQTTCLTTSRRPYGEMDELPPVTITAISDDGQGMIQKKRIFVDGSGATRVETYPTPDATEPTEYEIYSGTSMGHMLPVDGEPSWYQQLDAITEDSRVFVYAAMSGRPRRRPGERLRGRDQPGMRCTRSRRAAAGGMSVSRRSPDVSPITSSATATCGSTWRRASRSRAGGWPSTKGSIRSLASTGRSRRPRSCSGSHRQSCSRCARRMGSPRSTTKRTRAPPTRVHVIAGTGPDTIAGARPRMPPTTSAPSSSGRSPRRARSRPSRQPSSSRRIRMAVPRPW